MNSPFQVTQLILAAHEGELKFGVVLQVYDISGLQGEKPNRMQHSHVELDVDVYTKAEPYNALEPAQTRTVRILGEQAVPIPSEFFKQHHPFLGWPGAEVLKKAREDSIACANESAPF